MSTPKFAITQTSSAEPDEERAYYSRTRRIYDSWFATVYDAITWPIRRLRSRVARLAKIDSGMRVVDVVTQARAFADTGARVLATDLSPRMIAIARRKHRGRAIGFVEADATALPTPDASFDVFCVSFALHEMPPRIRASVVAEMVRVTRRVGTMFALFEPDRDQYVDFVRSDLDALLAGARISVREAHRALLGAARVVIGVREA